MSNHDKDALKAATTLLAAERAKASGGMGARKVAAKIKEDYNVAIVYRTISNYVKSGAIGVSPRKQGNPGKILPHLFQTLCTAVSSYIKINQLNTNTNNNE